MLLSELWESSMFHLQESSKPVKFQVNGFLHEYINSRPMEDNLVFALDGPCSLQSQRAGGQHLTIRDNWDRDMNVFQSIDFSRLRSLTVFGKCRPSMFDPKKIKMRYVRVLDLEDASGVTNVDLKHIVEVFPRLKFLSLRGCTKISRLPMSLGRLRQLQTLDVRHTSVATLPNAILKLQKLQNVRAGSIHSAPWDERRPEDAAATPPAPEVDVTTVGATPLSPALEDAEADDSCDAAAAPSSMPRALLPSWLSKLCCRRSRHDNIHHGVEVPAGIGVLMALHTFGIVDVGPGNNAVILKELHKLTQLRRLGVCGINMHNIRDFFSAISGLKHLRRLSVRFDKSMDGLFACLDHTIPSPPETLDKRLKLHGHVRILPSCSWIKKFANDSKLDLEVTLQEQQDMQVILDQLIQDDRISYMKRLCIKPIQDGELRIGINDERRFVGLRLEVLEIVCTTNLQATIGKIGAFDVLRVECSRGSSLKLSGLQGIRRLKEVWLKGSCSDTLREYLQHQLDQRQGPSARLVLI
jgi:hypothetical protein